MTSAALLAAAGYVRVPRAWISLSVSPGAKALLLQLCAAANDRGDSWYSYAQLGAIVMRSRAAVAGYVDELRSAGIVATLRQKTANGFNYRVKIRIIDWGAIVAGWAERAAWRRAASMVPGPGHERKKSQAPGLNHAGTESAPEAPSQMPDRRSPARPRAERGVHFAERKDPSGPGINPNQNNNPAPSECAVAPADALAEEEWSVVDEQAWKMAKHRDNDGHLGFDERPEEALLSKVIAVEAVLKRVLGWFDNVAEAEAAARSRLERFVTAHRLEAPDEAISAAAATLAGHARTPQAQDRAVAILEQSWQPHWRRLSSSTQLDKLLRGRLAEDPSALGNARLLGRFALRATLARRELAARARLAAELGAERGRADRPDGQPAGPRRPLPPDLQAAVNGIVGLARGRAGLPVLSDADLRRQTQRAPECDATTEQGGGHPADPQRPSRAQAPALPALVPGTPGGLRRSPGVRSSPASEGTEGSLLHGPDRHPS